MYKLLTVLTLVFLFTISANGQSIDSLKIADKEIPEGYSFSKRNNCISVQACLLYDNPEMYGALIGKLKSKQIQSFDSKKDKGSIMYFEFENDFQGKGFLGGLLWGGDEPTKAHPEEYYAKGHILVIWSFKMDSPMKDVSKNKIKALLK
jgi:hypothetical protein